MSSRENIEKMVSAERNRTFNLLIFDQQPQTRGFNGFPNVFDPRPVGIPRGQVSTRTSRAIGI
jgi:hypothetical protein